MDYVAINHEIADKPVSLIIRNARSILNAKNIALRYFNVSPREAIELKSIGSSIDGSRTIKCKHTSFVCYPTTIYCESCKEYLW